MCKMTEKLYYADAYISEFSATVLNCSACDGGYDVILDRSAFFPEEGGQSSDNGYISDACVKHVFERDGVIHHITDSPVSGTVDCRIDFAERFEKMQLHTAEHILCGIIHKMFGLDNVGFHLGDDEVTFDISLPLTREQLDTVEDAACEAVFSNVRVETSFPTPEQLTSLEYRAKLDLSENVRLVKIGDIDTCACCAPHVAYTGEIGAIKLLHAERHRGGMRIWMTAGRRAVADYRNKFENVSKIGAMLSVPAEDTASALEKYMSDTENLKYQLAKARQIYVRTLASDVALTDGNALCLLEEVGIEELRMFVNYALSRVGGMLVAIAGYEGDYKYVIGSKNSDLSDEAKKINAALSGRGGGRGNMIQGSFKSSIVDIKEYFGV